MNTPIFDFVKKYAEGNNIRFHVPGHKGCRFLGIEALDITEIDGADVLYHGNGIIRESENNATTLFGTKKTLYSAEGSSLSIRAMVYLACMYAKHKGFAPKIAAARNAHKVFMTACALLDVEVDWLFPDNNASIVSCDITPKQLEEYFLKTSTLPVAVYITSPDYLGNMADIKGLSEICHNHGVLLLVDNAHGAYLNFLPENRHPMFLGADLCCDSAHKTLPVLTGGGYLHLSPEAPDILIEKAEEAMSLFASTSPSYLILQSLDFANAYIDNGYKAKLGSFVVDLETIKSDLSACGFTLIGDEPLKITISTKEYGYTGDEVAEILREKGFVCEFHDPDYVCFMLTPENGVEALYSLKNALTSLPRRNVITEKAPLIIRTKKACSIREALLSDSVELPVSESENRIFANASLSCPPAIPIVVCGEIIDKTAIECMKYYGIEKVRVIAEGL